MDNNERDTIWLPLLDAIIEFHKERDDAALGFPCELCKCIHAAQEALGLTPWG